MNIYNRDIQNIIINYNMNKKLKLLDELIISTYFIELFLNDTYKFSYSKIIRKKYLNKTQYWDILPILTN